MSAADGDSEGNKKEDDFLPSSEKLWNYFQNAAFAVSEYFEGEKVVSSGCQQS